MDCHVPSLRGAQRRGNRNDAVCFCEEQPLAARSLRRGGTWRSRGMDCHVPSLRGAQRRGNRNDAVCFCEEQPLAARSLRLGGTWRSRGMDCHAALSGAGQEHRAADHPVCAVESVDDQKGAYAEGAPGMSAPAARARARQQAAQGPQRKESVSNSASVS
jgi:hypothetical protein